MVRVQDTGAGMSLQTLDNLFDPFVQGAQGLDRATGGLGLGLALVKGLAEMHGGKVSARSAGEGKGSEVTVKLPLRPPARSRLAVVPPPVRQSTRRRVLVVEDNLDAAESLCGVLELGGHEVVVATSGPEGVGVARKYKPEIVLCDIGLPGMDGHEVAKTLRADPDPRLRSTFLVALTGYALQEDVAKAKEAGFDRHVAKPASIESLEHLLAEAPVQPSAAQPSS
jgi:two-component system CheB/CheR fusion protein